MPSSCAHTPEAASFEARATCRPARSGSGKYRAGMVAGSKRRMTTSQSRGSMARRAASMRSAASASSVGEHGLKLSSRRAGSTSAMSAPDPPSAGLARKAESTSSS